MGSVFWPLLNESCNNKVGAVACGHMYFWQLLFGIIVPPLMNQYLTDGKVFIIFGVGSALGFIYTLLIVKETKGLNDEQLKRLYRKDN